MLHAEIEQSRAVSVVHQAVTKEAGEMTNSQTQVLVLTSVEELEVVRGFWQKNQYFPYSDIDHYIYELKNDPDIIRPHVVVFLKNNQPELLVAGRITRTCFNWKLGYINLASQKALSLEIIQGAIIGKITDLALRLSIGQILETLQKGEADVAVFMEIEADGEVNKSLSAASPSYSKDLTPELLTHFKLKLENSYDEYFKGRSKNTKKIIKNYANRLEKKFPNKIKLRCYKTPEEVDRAITDADSIAAQTYQRRIGVSLKDTPELRSKWNFLAKNGWLRVYVLYLEGKPCAFWSGVVYRNSYVSVFTGFDPDLSYYHPGQHLLIRMIQTFCANGQVKQIWFGQGEADYKRRFSNTCATQLDIFLFSPKFKGQRLRWTKASIKVVSNFAKKILTRLNISQKLKKHSRQGFFSPFKTIEKKI
jgi:hypothetical protein